VAVKYTLTPVHGSISYLPGPQNIGVIIAANGKDCAIVDSGLTKDNGKAILKTLAEAGLQIRAILNTHSHADHFGGNAHIVANADGPVRVYAPPVEEAFMRYPILEPSGLFAGAAPIKPLYSHFLYAPASPIDVVMQPGLLAIPELDLTIEAVDLKGHAPGQLGYLVGAVLLVGDLVLPSAVIDKYKVLYCPGVADHLVALDHALAYTERIATVVPAHSPAISSAEFVELVAINRARFVDTLDFIVSHLQAHGPQSSEAVLRAVCAHYDFTVATAEAYYLLQPTIYAHLSCLHQQGRIGWQVADNTALWSIA
jgi:glyoxylase-like metal-dependent hydrolase (beta-lactamase superfamily II)